MKLANKLNLSHRAALAGVAVLALLQFRYAWIVCQPPPHQDDWAFLASLFDAIHNGRLLAWFFQPYNGHMLVAACLAFWLDFRFLHLDLTWVRWLCPVVSLIAIVLWYRWLVRHRESGDSIAAALVAGALVIFSLSYWEDFTLAMGFSAYFSALLAGAGFAQLAETFARGSTSRRGYWRAGLCFAGSALTFGSGIAALAVATIWSILLVFGYRPGSKHQLSMRSVWLAPAVLGLLLISSYPPFVLGSLPLNWPLREFLYRFCLCVGAVAAQLVTNPANPMRTAVAFATGLILICLAVHQLLLLPQRKSDHRRHVFGTGLIACGLGTCFAVTYSRMFVPADQMLASRYSIHFALGILGLILCLQRQRFVFLALVSALAVSFAIGGRQEWQTAPFRRLAFRQMSELMLNLKSVSDEEIQQKFYWSGISEIRSVTQEMEQLKLGGFHNR